MPNVGALIITLYKLSQFLRLGFEQPALAEQSNIHGSITILATLLEGKKIPKKSRQVCHPAFWMEILQLSQLSVLEHAEISEHREQGSAFQQLICTKT